MNKITVIIAMIVASMMTGCVEEDVPTVAGLWNGTYGAGSEFYALFRMDGTVRLFANGSDTATSDKANGTYVIGADSVRIHYFTEGVLTEWSAAAISDAGFTTMTGTYGSGTNTSGAGTFSLAK